MQFMARLLGFAVLLACVNGAFGQAGPDVRQMVALSGAGWEFVAAGDKDTLAEMGSRGYGKADWSKVAVPHIFETRQNYNGLTHAWYRRSVTVPPEFAGKRLFVIFEGVTSIADVYVNGVRLGQHRGAYTRFLFDATSALHPGSNELAVRVDNRMTETKDLLPNRTGLYKLWGGINRKVWLLETEAIHVDPTDFASPGVYVTPTDVSTKKAKLGVEVLVRNDLGTAQALDVRATLLDPQGKAGLQMTERAEVKPGERASVKLAGEVTRPRLWEPGAPNLYHVRVEVLRDGKVVDAVTQPTGFRTVEFQWKERKIFVNGKRVKWYGVDLHPEMEEKGNAVSDDDLRANFDVMQDLGNNFLRLPHYPHAALEYDLCDEHGIFCWAEDGHSNKEDLTPAGEQIVKEMVKQNYNHPAIAMWSVGNEASEPAANAAVPLVRAIDSTRPVLAANMRCSLCDFTTQHTYPGWYGKHDIRIFVPQNFITETGVGGTVTTHTDYNKADYKVDKYEPEEYQQIAAENDFSKAFNPANEKLAMFTWWTMRDFSDKKYKGPIGINSKGLLTYAADKKDAYYLYRSYLRPNEPTVHITSKRYFLRQGAVDNGVKVYSNAKQITLTLNGTVVSTLANGKYSIPDGPYAQENQNVPASGSDLPAPIPPVIAPFEVNNVFYWPVPMRTGKNLISVTDGSGHTDSATVYFYGLGGEPADTTSKSLIGSLISSTAANPAYFMDMPVQAQWPIYSDLDSTADNSWSALPEQVKGAEWIALKRVTKPENATSLSFTMSRAGTVYVAASVSAPDPTWVTEAGFTAGTTFVWRNNEMFLVPARLYQRTVKAGDKVSLRMGSTDAVVMVKD